MTLTEFLLARIAEDEAEARDDDGTPTPVGMWDPDRVLAECEAKRLIVGRIACPNAPECGDPDCMVVHEDWQVLASVYAEHPDFAPAWRLMYS